MARSAGPRRVPVPKASKVKVPGVQSSLPKAASIKVPKTPNFGSVGTSGGGGLSNYARNLKLI